jgi:hypothetical protein
MPRNNKISLPLLMAAALQAPTPSAAKPTEVAEALTIVIDIYSGRPNPKVTIDATDVRALRNVLAGACSRPANLPTEPTRFASPNQLGYLGIHVYRPWSGHARPAPLISLFRNLVQLSPEGATLVCGPRKGAMQTTFYFQNASDVEKHIAQLAFRKGQVIYPELVDILNGIEDSRKSYRK